MTSGDERHAAVPVGALAERNGLEHASAVYRAAKRPGTATKEQPS